MSKFKLRCFGSINFDLIAAASDCNSIATIWKNGDVGAQNIRNDHLPASLHSNPFGLRQRQLPSSSLGPLQVILCSLFLLRRSISVESANKIFLLGCAINLLNSTLDCTHVFSSNPQSVFFWVVLHCLHNAIESLSCDCFLVFFCNCCDSSSSTSLPACH